MAQKGLCTSDGRKPRQLLIFDQFRKDNFVVEISDPINSQLQGLAFHHFPNVSFTTSKNFTSSEERQRKECWRFNSITSYSLTHFQLSTSSNQEFWLIRCRLCHARLNLKRSCYVSSFYIVASKMFYDFTACSFYQGKQKHAGKAKRRD